MTEPGSEAESLGVNPFFDRLANLRALAVPMCGLLFLVAACGPHQDPVDAGSDDAADVIAADMSAPVDVRTGPDVAAMPDVVADVGDQAAPFHYFSGIWGSGPDDVYVTAHDGTISHSSDHGVTWTVLETLPADLFGVWGTGPNDVYVYGGDGQAFHSTDAGAHWLTLTTGTRADLDAMWGSSPSDLYLVGSLGTILHATDHGATWTPQPLTLDTDGGLTSTNVDFKGVWGASASDVFVVGVPFDVTTVGVVVHSNGSGAWRLTAPRVTSPPGVGDIGGSSSTDLYVVPSGQPILHSTDDGATWTSGGNPGIGDVSRLWVAGASDLWVLGSTGATHSTDGAMTWSSVLQLPASTNATAIWGSATGDVYVVGANVIDRIQ